MRQDEMHVGSGTEAVPAARAFVVSCLRRWGADTVIDSAALVTTELVTNAVLHAGDSIRLIVSASEDSVRVEVHDGSSTSPVATPGSQEGMTGRGLALVSTMSSHWGVSSTGRGKVVWAELDRSGEEPVPFDDDVDPLAAFADVELDLDAQITGADPARPRPAPERGEHGGTVYTIELGDVPTDLLLAAKRHVDSLARELSLAAAGATSGVTPEVPAHLRAFADTILSEFAEARQEMQRQAAEAAANGQARTHLTLTLPVEAADAAERYLAAPEELDAYARAARLLSLETPREHRVFRRWYVPSLVEALRHAAHGEPPTIPASFERYLLTQVVHLAEPWRIAERAGRLRRAVTALTGAATDEAVALIAVREAMAEVGAARGAVILAGDEATPARLVAGLGIGPDVATASLTHDLHLPWREVLRTRTPMWIDTRDDCEHRFPDLLVLLPDLEGACLLPLATTEAPLGTLGLSFTTPPRLDEDQRAFLQALAASTAAALKRVALVRERDRLRDGHPSTRAV